MKRLKKTLYLAMMLAMGPGIAVSMFIDKLPVKVDLTAPFSERVDYFEKYINKNLTESDVNNILSRLTGSEPEQSETALEK